MLKHPVYIGKTHHQGALHDGQHAAIIEPAIWEQVGALIQSQARNKEGKHHPSGLWLKGKIYDLEGKKYRCHYSEKPNKRRHYYYVSHDKNRLPAVVIEKALITTLQHPETLNYLRLNEAQQLQWHKLLHHQPAQLLQSLIGKITIGKQATWINLATNDLESYLQQAEPLQPISLPTPVSWPTLNITPKADYLEIQLHQSFAEKNAIYAHRASRYNESLRTALGQAYRWQQMLQNDPELDQRSLAKAEGVDYRYLTRALHMMMLAPDIMTAMLDGTQPNHLSMTHLRKINIPICWQAQRKLLGFAD